MMKKLTGFIIIMLVVGGIAFSQSTVNNTNLQNGYNAEILKKLGFTDSEVNGLIKIQENTQRVIINARAELDIYRAELKKLLLSPDVSMRDVEKILRKSMNWELKLRMAQIRQQVDSRKLVGEKKWVILVRYTQRLRAKKINAVQGRQKNITRQNKTNKAGNNSQREAKIKRLLKELEQLLNEKRQ